MAVFRHSRLDLIAVLVCASYPACLVLGAALYPAMSGWQIAAWAVLLFLLWQSGSYAYHHHNHLHFFTSNVLNRAFEIMCSAGWRIPVSREAYYHFIHHSPGFLATKDASYNDPRRVHGMASHVGLLSLRKTFYSLFDTFGVRWMAGVLWRLHRRRGRASPARVEPAGAAVSWRRKKDDAEPWEWTEFAIARGQTSQIVLECGAIIAFNVLLAALDPRYYLTVCAPVQFVAYVVYDLQDFCEHTRTDLRYPETISASCYGLLYNLWLFNGGYHLEHHWREGVHWSRIPEVRKELLAEDQRRVVPWSMFLSPLVRGRPLISPRSVVRRSPPWTLVLEASPDRLTCTAVPPAGEAGEGRARSRELPLALRTFAQRLAGAGEPVQVSDAAAAAGAPLAAAVDFVDWLRALGAVDLVFAATPRSTARALSAVPEWNSYPSFP